MSARAIAVDWSGRRRGAEKSTWLAEAVANRLVRLENGRSRGEVAEHLVIEAERGPRMVVGLDFAFSLPAWFLAERSFSGAPELWRLADREAERWLAECRPPFWGRPFGCVVLGLSWASPRRRAARQAGNRG